MFWKKRTYLDYATGASGLARGSSRAEGNPSSPHAEGRRSRGELEGARTAIARLTEVKPDDVIFTSGATEANALVILGLAKPGDHVLYLPGAHASIVENIKLLAARGVVVEALPIKNGRVDTESLTKMLRPETRLVAMEAVCGETGTIWNTREIAQVLRATGKRFLAPSGLIGMSQPVASKSVFPSRALLHVDASQAPFTQKISRAHFNADLLVFDSAKVGGPRGVGCLIAHRTIPIAPLYGGGWQERGLRSGTENVEAITGFAAALRAAALGREDFSARAARQRAQLVAVLAGIPHLYINEGHEGVPYILNLSLPGRDTDYLVALLDELGFALSTRSACETDSAEGSRAVLALTGDEARARATLRISWGPTTSPRDLKRFAEALRRVVAFIDSVGA